MLMPYKKKMYPIFTDKAHQWTQSIIENFNSLFTTSNLFLVLNRVHLWGRCHICPIKSCFSLNRASFWRTDRNGCRARATHSTPPAATHLLRLALRSLLCPFCHLSFQGHTQRCRLWHGHRSRSLSSKNRLTFTHSPQSFAASNL